MEDKPFKIVFHDGTEFPCSYEVLVELLAAIRDTPLRGNECFDEAKEFAWLLLERLPKSDY